MTDGGEPRNDGTTEGDELMAALRSAVHRLEPVPDEVVAAAKGSYVWRTIDDELAALTADTLTESALAGVRGQGNRSVTFALHDIVVELEITDRPMGVALTGQVIADDVDSVQLQSPMLTTDVPVDALGRFRVDVPVPGPVRLRCRLGGERIVTTEWVSV
jgi:hypothetical protein